MQREFPQAPLVGVGAVIVDRGRVLLVKRGTEPAKGIWTLPGGLIEVGELLTDAVVREVEEETGLRVESLGLIELIDRIHRDGDRIRYHYVIADYLCRVVGGSLLAASDADEARWVDRDYWLSSLPSAQTVGSGLAAPPIDPVTARVLEAGWQRARAISSNGSDKL